ncbi:IS701 family transposase [Streptomyces narbonensis]|uniref:IS701 family transposase n=1 Tax=Streptomyces narbonensis TaxID=67333 RepID=UPI003F542139
MSRIAGRFTRVESRRRARELVLGLLSDLPRKNCWTGDVKKGTDTFGVQCQYTGTAGRVENSPVAVYLAYSTPRGRAAIDRELDVPRSWTSDPDRCRAAGLGDKTEFATKPELAARTVTRFLDAGHRAAWVAGDEVYGGNPRLRAALEERGTGYVLAVACSHEVTTAAGKFRADTAGQEGAQEGLAEAVRRGRSQGPPLLRLGRRRPHRPPAREPAVADPPQPQHRRTRVLPLPLAGRSAADHPGARRWIKVAGRGVFPVRQEPGGLGQAPGPALLTLVPLGHPGHVCARLPPRRPRERTRPSSLTRRADTAHLQRDPTTVHHARHPTRHCPCPPAWLVRLATPPPGPIPDQPLPTTSRASMKITIYGWSTRRNRPRTGTPGRARFSGRPYIRRRSPSFAAGDTVPTGTPTSTPTSTACSSTPTWRRTPIARRFVEVSSSNVNEPQAKADFAVPLDALIDAACTMLKPEDDVDPAVPQRRR